VLAPQRASRVSETRKMMLRSILAGAAWLAVHGSLWAQGVVGDAIENMLRPSVSSVSSTDGGSGGRTTGYVAQHPNPNEPLGFSQARFNPSPAVDPGMDSGLLSAEPIEEYYDPTDPDAPAPTVSSGEWLQSGRWYATQSAVYITRSTSVKNITRLATDLSSAAIPANFSHLEIAPNPGYAPGLRSTVGAFLGRDPRNRDHAVEFTFLGLTHWSDAASLTAKLNGAIFSNIDPTRLIPAFNGSNFQSYAQTSTFNSYELNYRINRRLNRDQLIYSRDSTWVRQVTRAPLPSIFAGLRVVSIAETLKYLANSSTANGTYNISTHNDMVGLQAGADWFIERYEWRVGGRLKGASVVNFDNQSSNVRILNTAGAPLLPNRNEFAKDQLLAFIAEMSFVGAYQFSPNFAFRTSYDLMWVTNLALAQNEITFAPSTPVQISSQHSLFFQGVSIGFEFVR
jgi:hypothetical protein